MSTVELKNALISKIEAIDDEAFLLALNTLLDSKSESRERYEQNLKKIILLSEQKKKEIQNSQKEYAEGNYFDNDVVNEAMEKWLKEE